MSPLKYLIEKYRKVKDDYMNRSPKGKWMIVRDVGNMFLRFIGVAYLDPKFKVSWYSYAPAIVMIDVFLSCLYTLWFYSTDEPIKGILVISLLGILTSVSIYL